MDNATQILDALASSPALTSIQNELNVERVLANAIAIQQIPAPTFEEAQRADYIQQRFSSYTQLDDVHIDDVYNVYGRWPGQDSGLPALLVSAHTDTVFSLDTDLSIAHRT
jgi:acetylornithine deacetylase/succinyl-diaminopimelate desuccinylase-like protein